MKKNWKWIIAIVLGLIVLAVLVSFGFMLHSSFHVYRGESQIEPGLNQHGNGMMPYGRGFENLGGPGMMGRGEVPFGGFIGRFFGGLVMLGFLALVVLGIIWLVRRLSLPPHVAVAAGAPVGEPVAAPIAIDHPCQKCGKPIQEDWKVCPYCGKKV